MLGSRASSPATLQASSMQDGAALAIARTVAGETPAIPAEVRLRQVQTSSYLKSIALKWYDNGAQV
jgi:hypothetical protein